MAKAEFLYNLERRLQVLNKKERDDILSEYSQHIDMRMESGLSEEEAIKDFGDFDELASEILEAYNLNPNYNKTRIDSGEISKKVTGAFSKLTEILKDTFKRFKVFLSKIPLQRPSTLVKLVLLVLAIIIVYFFAISIVFEIASFCYSILPHLIDDIAAIGIMIVFHVIYIVLSITLLYTFITNQRERKLAQIQTETPDAPDDAEPVKKKKLLRPFPILKNIKLKRKEKGDENKMQISLLRSIADFFSVVFKFIIICLLIPIVFCVFLAVVCFGLLLVLCFLGYPVIGIAIGTFGAATCGVTFIWFIWDLLIKNKEADE